MRTRFKKGVELRYECPVCGTALAVEPPLPPADASCPRCRYSLWCCKRTVDGIVILRVLCGRTPDCTDIESLVHALTSSGDAPRVVVDLCELAPICSEFAGRMIALRKRIQAAKGRLILCGLHPIVREAFRCAWLDKFFEISEDKDAALASLRSQWPRGT